MEIRYYQKNSDCLYLAKKPFRGLCLELAARLSSGIVKRYTRESVIVLQMAVEKYLSDYFAMAYHTVGVELTGKQECTFHRKAKTVIPKDMYLVRFFENALGVGGSDGPPKTVG